MTEIPTGLQPGDKLWYSETECATVGPTKSWPTCYDHNSIRAQVPWSADTMIYYLDDGREYMGQTPPIIRIERVTSAPIQAQKPKPDPLIFGASIPGCEPVPKRDEYVPLTKDEAENLWRTYAQLTFAETVRAIHRAGWERRRAP